MTKNIENKIKEILEELPNENSELDYKVIEYKMKNKNEIIKDVLAMLNSLDSYEHDKFIIFGVSDNKNIVGLKENMSDDAKYQEIFDTYIEPRPKLETGQIEYKKESLNKKIGYFFISSDNLQTPYEIKKDLIFESRKGCLPAGASYIRTGSRNPSLLEKDREELILRRTQKNPNEKNIYHSLKRVTYAKKETHYKNECTKDTATINPSNNDGNFTIGKQSYEFTINFEVASNEIARIYKTNKVEVARIKNYKKNQVIQDLKENSNQTNKIIEKLDTSSRFRNFTVNDVAILINQHGRIAKIFFEKIKSESHGSEKDLIKFRWEIDN